MKNELALYSMEDACKLAELLINNGYVVMLSTEEKLFIVNYENGTYVEHLEKEISDRNAVIFMGRDEFEEKYFEVDEPLDNYE